MENRPIFRNKENQKKEHSVFDELFDWFDAIIAAVVIVVIIFTFVFRVVGIKGSSMEKTLIENDKVVITNMSYTPKKGDIVVISRNYSNDNTGTGNFDEPIIKRVIATEGQWVDIDFDNGIVYVDGKEIEEPYINMPTTVKHDVDFPLQVTKGHIFVMGDNRDVSNDSRSSEIGLVDTRYVLGKAVYRIFPFSKIGGLK